MMSVLPYRKEHFKFRERLRAFCLKEIIPYVDQWENEHIVPRRVWQKMGDEGFLCTALSTEYGGIGGDFLYSIITTEEILKTNHLGLHTPLHSDMVVPYIESYGSSVQKQKYLPGCVTGDIITAIAMTEPDAGSDLAAMTTTAVEDGNEVIINGAKTFISNGINCDLVVLAAKDPTVDNRHKAISLYLVEDGTPGFNKGRRLEKMGMHSQDTIEMFFSNCIIPTENRLGDKGEGFVMLMQKLQQERILAAVMAQVRAEWALDWTLGYWRSQHSDDGNFAFKSQADQFAFSEMATEIKIVKCFLEKLVLEHMEKNNVVTEASMAKYWTSDMVKRIVGRCMDAVGDVAADERCPLVRAFRDVQITSIYAGTNEIMKTIIAKQMTL